MQLSSFRTTEYGRNMGAIDQPKRFDRAARGFVGAGGVVCFSIGLVFLAIWLVLPQFKEFSAIMMKANTCLALALASAAIWLLRDDRSAALHRVGRVMAFSVLLIGGLTCLEYAFHFSFGIDEFLVSDFRNAESALHPGRMSPIASVSFTLLALGIITVDRPKRFGIHFPTLLLFPVLTLNVLAISGYIYHISAFYTPGQYIRIGWLPSILLSVLSLCALSLRPERGIAAYFYLDTLGGNMVRRFLPLIVVVPIALGWLEVEIQRSQFIDHPSATAVFVMIRMVLFVLILLSRARILNSVDLQRKDSVAKLREAVQARDDFLSIASHELFTPLSVLKLQAQLFARRRDKGDPAIYEPETINSLVALTENQTTNLARLVDDMLDVGRLRAGSLRLQRETFALDQLVGDVVGRLLPSLVEAGTPPELVNLQRVLVNADRLRIEQVIVNLLTNVMRYGNRQPVRIFLNTGSGNARVRVEDRGLGIASEDLEKIFDRFERSRGSAGSRQGLGLGLFISKKIVELHGGRIGVESEPGRGSTFTVDLPTPMAETSH